MTPKEKNQVMVNYAAGLLEKIDNPTPADLRAVRAAVAHEFGCIPKTAYNVTVKAARLLAGEPVPQWGGHRPDAGRPRKQPEEE